MLVGLWGPFAVGKTTFLNAYMCRHADQPSQQFRRTTFVMADLQLEYSWRASEQRWADKTANHWKSTQADKVQRIDDMMADDRHTWVIESARYFSGMYECLTEAFQRYDGGLAFIIPVTDGPTMTIFMRERCEVNGKVFRDDYWDAKRVAYEAGPRYINAATKWFTPLKIPWVCTRVERNREQFSAVDTWMTSYITKPVSWWYGMSERWQADMDRIDGRRARR